MKTLSRPLRPFALVALCAVIPLGAAATGGVHPPPAVDRPAPLSADSLSAAHDFDFYVGRWAVTNRRLRKPLTHGTDWYAFPAVSVSVSVLDGAGNADQFTAPSQHIVGMTLRLFDPARNQWSLYWVNRADGILQPPVVGRFSGAIGDFYNEDTYAGRPVRVRYRWTKQSAQTARWEQAFSVDSGQTWETNWIMDMARVLAVSR